MTFPYLNNNIRCLGVLKQGSTGEAVFDLQKRLRREDIPIALDGWFGPLTEEALKVYQSGQKIAADGIAGPRTWLQFEDSG